MPSRRTWAIAAGLALASPAVRSATKGAAVLTEILPSPLHPLTRFSPPPRVTRIDLAHGVADLYQHRPGAPGVVLVHGANIGGIDDPRVRGLAGAFCRVGRTVLAPSLNLAERRLDLTDLARIRDAVDALADRSGPVVIVAFSYGGALALCALAQHPAIQGRVRAIATIGTYFDLVHLIGGVTTGQVLARGSLHPWQPPAAAMEQAGGLLAHFLGGDDAAATEAALGSRQPEALSPAARAAYDLVVNRDPWRVEALVGQLPQDVRDLLDRLSPARHIGAIRIPLFALHSRVDPAAPAIESEELVDAVRRRAKARLTLVGSFRHVTPTGTILGWGRDLPGLIHFTESILRTQERWLPRRPPQARIRP